MTKRNYGVAVRCVILLLLATALVMCFYVKTEAVPIGTVYLDADSIVDGNIFYVTVAMNGAADVAGGQGILHYDATKLRLLEFVPHLPEGWAWDMYDKNGEVSFLFYIDREKEIGTDTDTVTADTSDTEQYDEQQAAENESESTSENDMPSEEPSENRKGEYLNGECELFNLYFQIESEPQDNKVNIYLDNVLLSDTVQESRCPQSNVSIVINNYVPPVTIEPTVTTSEIETAETEPVTAEETGENTTTFEETDDITEETTGEDTDTLPSDTQGQTAVQSENTGNGSRNEIRIIHVVAVAVICTAVSGGVVYFTVKRKANKK